MGVDCPLDAVREWLGRYIIVLDDGDLDVLTLWAAHTWLVREVYSTPRLLIDSPVPGSGKTTVLEHLDRLCLKPVQMAAISSPAMLARLLDVEMRTMLIDEVDRTLRPDADGTPDMLAILNTGYKIGASRPVLVPSKDAGWVSKEMPTFAPVAMAGNSPRIPDDTRSRSIRILLLPDLDGRAEESDWEVIGPDAELLGAALSAWADDVRGRVAAHRPAMPDGITGRLREKWQPLKRVAVVAGGRWPAAVDRLALADKEQIEADREDGLIADRPHIVLLRDIAEVWPAGREWVPTSTLIDALVFENPDAWSDSSPYGKRLTAKRLGKMLTNFNVNSTYETTSHTGKRGYRLRDLGQVMGRMGIPLSWEATQATYPPHPTQDAGSDGGLRSLGSDTERVVGATGPEAPVACRIHGTAYKPDVCVTCESLATHQQTGTVHLPFTKEAEPPQHPTTEATIHSRCTFCGERLTTQQQRRRGTCTKHVGSQPA